MLQSKFLKNASHASHPSHVQMNENNYETVEKLNTEEQNKDRWVQVESEVLGHERVLVVFNKVDLADARKVFPGIPIYFPPEIESLWELKQSFECLRDSDGDDRLSPPHSPYGDGANANGGNGGRNQSKTTQLTSDPTLVANKPSTESSESLSSDHFFKLLKMVNLLKKNLGGWVVPK